ncbi:MAG: MFS transporter [Betaproteobacteria bacterium]|nr:MFS transporter [Betaproteobacteria bacterium]
MPAIYLITLLTLMVQGGHMGSRMVASLFAIELGANPFLIGALISAYSVFPLLLGVYSGRLSDRFGSRRPMLAGTAVLAFGLLLPFLWPQLAALYVSAALIGTGFVFFNVSVQNLAGGLGTAEERTRNFSTLGLGYSGGHMLGPLLGGYAIDYHGFPFAYLCFAALIVLPMGLLAWNRRLDVAPRAAGKERTSTLELLHSAPLRRAIVTSALVVTGWDLYAFYVPLYGHSIGLSASSIGILLGVFAVATFVVRIVLPLFTRRYGVETVLSIAMFAGAAFFLLFPFITFVPALLALSFGIGFTLGCGQPLTLNIAYNRSPPGRSGEVTGLRLTINNVTHIGVPLAAGALGATLGVAPVFWVNAAILAASGRLSREAR